MSDNAPLWTRNFILVSSINFQLVLTFYLLVVVIVGYAVAELGATTAQAGLISGLFIVGTLIGRLLVGKFLERFGRKTTMISRPFTGPLMDRKGENIIMYPAFIIMAIALVLLSQAHSSFMLLLCAGLLGFGYGNIQSVCQTVAVKSANIERMGFATSTFFIFLDAGLGFGPYFIGQALDYISYAQLYFYSAMAVLACIVIYFLLHGRTASKHQQASA